MTTASPNSAIEPPISYVILTPISPTTIYLWLISLTASKELSILLLKLYNDGAIGIAETSLGFAPVI